MKPIIDFVQRRIGPMPAGFISAGIVYLMTIPEFATMVQSVKETDPKIWFATAAAFVTTWVSRLTPTGQTEEPNKLTSDDEYDFQPDPNAEAKARRIEVEAMRLDMQKMNEELAERNAKAELVRHVEKINSKTDPREVAAKLPIGIRQNNPLNIRPTADGRTRWVGEIDTDTGYAMFENRHYGLRAAAYLLRISYYERRELHSVKKIIERWAPYHDNHPDSVRGYIRFVCEQMMVEPEEDIGLNVLDINLVQIMKAMCRFENAQQMPYTNTEIMKAINDLPTTKRE